MADRRTQAPPQVQTQAQGGYQVFQVPMSALAPTTQAMLMQAARVANADPATFIPRALDEWAAMYMARFAPSMAPTGYPPPGYPPGYPYNPYHAAFAGGGYPGAADYRAAFGY